MFITIVKGDHGYDLNFTLEDADENVVDITDSVITLEAQAQETPSVHFEGSMDIVNATQGRCKYTVQQTDFPEAGTYNAQIKVVYNSTGEQITFSGITINVEDRVPASTC